MTSEHSLVTGLFAGMLSILFSPLSLADPAPTTSKILGVVGKDDRQAIETVAQPWNAIGRVNIGGVRRTSHCTGTLIGPRLVITAAHCLIDRASGKRHAPRNIHFLPGAKRGTFLAHGRADCVKFLDGSQQQTSSVSSRLRSDVAVIVLKKPVQISPFPLATEVSQGAELQLQHASYSRDRRYVLMADQSCEIKAVQAGLWFTNCDTNFGGSGGPVILRQDGELMLSAIMVGVIKNKYSIAVPIGLWRNLANKDRCP